MGAVLLFALNNFWGKSAFPGFWTGKISDICYMLFMPSLWAMLLGWLSFLSRRDLIRWSCASLATSVPFVLMKASEPFSQKVNEWVGKFWALWGLAARPNLADASDLLSLLVLPFAVCYGAAYERRYLLKLENHSEIVGGV